MSDRKETNEEFFATPFWSTQIPEWVDDVNKTCQPYLDESHEAQSEYTKEGDMGRVYHSGSIENDFKLKFLVEYIGGTACNLLQSWGNDISNHKVVFDSMWVQEFARDGGGHHRVHIHENCHVSGFYFLQNEDSSYPLFHDPRQGSAMTSLPELDSRKITPASRTCNVQPEPGHMYMFPSYLPHEYIFSKKGGAFRFIHFNLSAVPLRYFGEGSVE